MALVRVPFYFINLWLIPYRQSYCTLHYYYWYLIGAELALYLLNRATRALHTHLLPPLGLAMPAAAADLVAAEGAAKERSWWIAQERALNVAIRFAIIVKNDIFTSALGF